MKKTTLRKLTEIEDETLKTLLWEANLFDETVDELLEREDGRRCEGFGRFFRKN